MRGRIYDPKVGRFLTTDPIVSHPGFGQSWNPYTYVLNNPLAYVDPSGFGMNRSCPMLLDALTASELARAAMGPPP